MRTQTLSELDELTIALFVRIDDQYQPMIGPGRPGKLSDTEMISLGVLQGILGRNDCAMHRFINRHLRHLFPIMINRPAYCKRLNKLTQLIDQARAWLGNDLQVLGESTLLVDSTHIPCAESSQTIKRSKLGGDELKGRRYWGYRLHLISTRDGFPIADCLSPSKPGEREQLVRMLERLPVQERCLVADCGYDGKDYARFLRACYQARILHPSERNHKKRTLEDRWISGLRQPIESTFNSLKDQMRLEDHKAITVTGLERRVAQRLLALGAVIWYNKQLGRAPRTLALYDC